MEASIAVLVWGASFIATKLALREVSPITVIWLRFAMGVLVLGIAVVARRQLAWVRARELGYFGLLGFLGVALHQWLQSNGLVTSQATTTAWIVTATPVFIAVLAWLFLGERLGRVQIVGIMLAATGVLVVVTRGQLSSPASGQFGTPGDVLIIAGGAVWAVFSVLSRSGLKNHPATRMLFYVMALGWLFTCVPFFRQAGPAEIGQLTLTGWLSIGFLGVLCSGLCYILWYDALQSLPASQVGAFLYVEPLVAAVVAAVLLQETLGAAGLLGGATIMIGVWLVNRRTQST